MIILITCIKPIKGDFKQKSYLIRVLVELKKVCPKFVKKVDIYASMYSNYILGLSSYLGTQQTVKLANCFHSETKKDL